MRRTAGSLRSSQNANENSLNKKTTRTPSSVKTKAPIGKENARHSHKLPTEDKYSENSSFQALKFGSPKELFDNMSNMSLEASLSFASLKNINYKNKNEQESFTAEEPSFENRIGLDRDDLGFNAPLEDAKMTSREITIMRRSLNEAQARAISATKELSKVQYEKTVVENQLKKTDMRCKDLIEQKALDQSRINELNYLNSQLNAELVKMRIESQSSSGKTKDNLEKLKQNLLDVEEAIEKKNQKAIKTLKKMSVTTNALEKLVEVSLKDSTSSKSRNSFDKLHDMIEKLLQIISAKGLSELRRIRDDEEYEAIESYNEIISTLEKDSSSLKSEVSQLKEQLEREQTKNKEIIPQYKSSVARLKKNTQLIRDKLKDIQDLRIKEKKEFEEKLKVLEGNERKLSDQNQTLINLNKRLNTQLEESERMNTENTFKVKNLVMENAKISARASSRLNSHETLQREILESARRLGSLHHEELEEEPSDDDMRLESKRSTTGKLIQNSSSRKNEGFSNYRKSVPTQEPESSRRSRSRVEGIASHRSSQKMGKFEDREYSAGPRSFSARKEISSFDYPGKWENKTEKKIGWDDYEGHTESRRSTGLGGVSKRNYERQEEQEEEHEEIYAKENEENNDDYFQRYLDHGEEFNQTTESLSRPVGGLKEEIVSLDNEIYEIQRRIKEELES